MSRGRRTFLWSALNYLRSLPAVATSIGMAVTCTFLVFFSTVSLSEEEIRTFAPVVLSMCWCWLPSAWGSTH